MFEHKYRPHVRSALMTVVFSDVVDSTALAARLGADLLVAMSHEWLARIAFDAGRTALAHSNAEAAIVIGARIGTQALVARCEAFRR